MKGRVTVIQRAFVAAVLVVLGVLPAGAAPITITNVQVTIGGATYTAAIVGWDFSGGGVTLMPGEDLVLAQNFQGTPNQTTSYNFDTSDVLGPLNFPQISITVNGLTTIFTDTNQVLNTRGLDQNVSELNEAQNFGLPMIGPGYQVFLGYADNLHTGACGNGANLLGLNGSSTSIFLFRCDGLSGPRWFAARHPRSEPVTPQSLQRISPHLLRKWCDSNRQHAEHRAGARDVHAVGAWPGGRRAALLAAASGELEQRKLRVNSEETG